MRAVLLSLLAFGLAAHARTPAERLNDQRLEAVHSQIVEWKKTRRVFPAQGVYQDFRAVFLPAPAAAETLAPAANNAEVRVVFGASTQATRDGVLYLAAPGDEFHGTDISGEPDQEPSRLAAKFKQRPDEAFGADEHASITLPSGTVLFAKTHMPPVQVAKSPIDAYTIAFRHATTHILAADLTEPAVRAALAAGHAYVAHDWLCDPTGAAFFAQSYFGLFEMGDTVSYNPAAGGIALAVRLPVPATIRLLRDNAVVAEARHWKLDYTVRDQGAYRLEASLAIDGEERPWISTNPIFVRTPVSLNRPAVPPSEDVDVRSGISYTDGGPADAAEKHKLDLYLPKRKKDFPVLVFTHGGSWRTGDRSLYKALGDRFARAGIGVAIPSYRLMPQNPHPAQIEDLAAAFAWVARNIAQYGGDPSHIYLSGHSAGAHLAALLALDDKYLRKFDLSPAAIRGVIAMSGIYDVASLDAFVASDEKYDKRDASPLAHAHISAPPFWITYCQWDYLGLPKQARDFAAALRKNFVSARLLYVPGESHISEAISLAQEHGLLVDTILSVVK